MGGDEASLDDAERDLEAVKTTLGNKVATDVEEMQRRVNGQRATLSQSVDADTRRSVTEEARAILQNISRLKHAPENRANVVLRELSETQEAFDRDVREHADATSVELFDRLADTVQQAFRDGDMSGAERALKEMEGILHRELLRNPGYLIYLFKTVSSERHLSVDKALHDRYAAMGVQPPSGILLYGPPGSGKTFAVRMLANYLGWPVFELGMGKIGSPFIHQTSVRLNALFHRAAEKAPSIVVIDEVDALAGARGIGSQDYKVEEISELVKLVEAAAGSGVILVATTNRKEAIDPAFLRKGRFDHAFEVDYPDAEEVLSVLGYLVSERPHVPGLGLATAAERLACRPMSDAAWVVNEAARLAVKSSKDAIDDICLFGAISKLK